MASDIHLGRDPVAPGWYGTCSGRAARRRLQTVKAELEAAETSIKALPIPLDDILTTWTVADAQGRRELLGASSTSWTSRTVGSSGSSPGRSTRSRWLR